MADLTETPTAPPVEALRTRQRPEMLTSAKVTVNRFDIDLGRPLAEYDHNYAEAYESLSHDTGINDHVAFIIKGRYPVRQDVIAVSMIADFGNMMSLRFAGAVPWPDNSQRYVMIYRRPSGHPMIPKNQRRENYTEDLLRRAVVKPIFYALRALAEKSVFHGNIRPDNIFLALKENEEASLGECATSIPGINQPALYETIERSMADVHGKGVGTIEDDIYAFGATMAVLLRGFNPFNGKSAEEITEDKINRGSFTVLTDGLRLSPSFSEFLRATLNDDPEQRWDINQLTSWVEGTRTTPRQSITGQRAQRALEFNGKAYLRPRVLAKDLLQNVTEAVTLIENGQITKWLERAMNDEETAAAVNSAIARAGASGRAPGYEDRLLCFVSMALDPRAPIRFKELRVLPSGIGYSLAFASITGAKVQAHGEIIRDRYAWNWLNSKENTKHEVNSDLIHTFDQVSKIIIRRGIDFGLERCLYELCRSCPCLSPLFGNAYVNNCNALLTALESIADGKRQDVPMDRHIASFISVHDSRDNAGLLILLEGNNAIKKSLAVLTLYQSLQKRSDSSKLPGLCEWLMKDAEIVAQRFHNLTFKQDVIKQIPKTVKTGSLSKLLALVDNPTEVKKDEHDFMQAGKYYFALEREKEVTRQKLEQDSHFGRSQGRQVALAISIILSAIMIAMTVMTTYFNGKGF